MPESQRSTRHSGRQNRGHHRHFHKPRLVNISNSHLPRKRRSADYTVLDDLRIGADNSRDNGEVDLTHSFKGVKWGGYINARTKVLHPHMRWALYERPFQYTSIFCEMIKPVTLAAIFEAVVSGRMQTVMCHSTMTCNRTCL